MPKKCMVTDCVKDISKGANGLCGMHYMRMKRYGDVNYKTPESLRRQLSRHSQPKLGRCGPKTYKKYLGRHLHRHLMEQKLGRKLLSSEHVHHIDGNKHNNNLENLIVLTSVEHGKQTAKEKNSGERLVRFMKGMKGKPPLRTPRFNAEEVRKIRSDIRSNPTIAKEFKVSASTIQVIKVGKIYKYVK